MALNLVKAGHEVVVFDLVAEAVARLTDAGARAAASAEAAVQGVDIVITMLPASKHVEGLYLEQNLLGRIPAGALVIDCSTIAPDAARKVAAAAQARGLEMIDAPVSGGTGGAAAGTLTFIVGARPPPWSARVRCSRRWARISSTPGKRERGRSPRSATTCCWAS